MVYLPVKAAGRLGDWAAGRLGGWGGWLCGEFFRESREHSADTGEFIATQAETLTVDEAQAFSNL